MGILMVSGDRETHIFFVSEVDAESRATFAVSWAFCTAQSCGSFRREEDLWWQRFHCRRRTLPYPRRLELAVFIGKEVGELAEDGNHCCECSTFAATVPGHPSFRIWLAMIA